jgi:hypothetical protein
MDRFEGAVEASEQVRDASTASSSATGSKRFVRSHARSEDTLGFGTLPDPVRVAMSLIVRQADSPDAALGPVIELLVAGDAAKHAAIVAAFRSNEPLREQWLRTYEILRG